MDLITEHYILLIVLSLIILFAGMLDGLRDDIELHDSLKIKWKWYDLFWSRLSWNGKKFLGMFVINGFHISKFLCFLFLSIAISIPLAILLSIGFWGGFLFTIMFTFLFAIGFNITWT